MSNNRRIKKKFISALICVGGIAGFLLFPELKGVFLFIAGAAGGYFFSLEG